MVKTMALNDLKYWDARSTKKKKKSKACNTQKLPVEPDNSNSLPNRLETSRAEVFAKPQSATAITRKDSRIHWRREGKRSI